MRCSQCNKRLNKKDKKVLVGTYRDDETLEEKWFHFGCWIDHFNQAIIKRINIGTSVVMKAMGKNLQHMLGENHNG